ncbi:MAG: hypothetical protein GWO24_05265, partial [Akkermansiaceae bacterium]|nr:hypothetical protein [Akkermansiaceae bacterium]
PLEKDTDGDKFSDGVEVQAGHDPTDDKDKPGSVVVQPSFVPINSNAAELYGPVLTQAGMNYQENHYSGGVIFNNNAQNNYDVHTSGSPPPNQSDDFIVPYLDHGGGGNTISTHN